MWFDPIIKTILRSPLHFFISNNMMLMTYKGRKSGQVFSVPMNYFRIRDQSGEFLATTSKKERVWWRNLSGGSPVSVRIAGEDVQANAEAFEDESTVLSCLQTLFQQHPGMAKYFNVEIDKRGILNPDDLLGAAAGTIFVVTRLENG